MALDSFVDDVSIILSDPNLVAAVVLILPDSFVAAITLFLRIKESLATSRSL